MSNIEVVRHELAPYPTAESRKVNNEKLSEGVKGIACTMVVIKPSAVNCDFLSDEVLKQGETISSCEVYANGAVNFFIRNKFGTLSAYIMLRVFE